MSTDLVKEARGKRKEKPRTLNGKFHSKDRASLLILKV